MKVTRLYTGEDNQSHFEEIDISLKDHGDIGHLSDPIKATSMILRETDSNYSYQWHNAPRRQFVVMLGDVEIEVGDGTKRCFTSGDIVICEDVAGRGHVSRAVEGKPRKSIFITLD